VDIKVNTTAACSCYPDLPLLGSVLLKCHETEVRNVWGVDPRGTVLSSGKHGAPSELPLVRLGRSDLYKHHAVLWHLGAELIVLHAEIFAKPQITYGLLSREA
jgi:hypothetical protein